jgi:hypothetical protein
MQLAKDFVGPEHEPRWRIVHVVDHPIEEGEARKGAEVVVSIQFPAQSVQPQPPVA